MAAPRPPGARLAAFTMDILYQSINYHLNTLINVFAIDPARLTEPEILLRLLLQVLLLMGSAFFSGSETSLFSLSRLDLQQLRRERHQHAETLHALLDHPRRLIISILCGNELINIAAAVNMTSILVMLYGPENAGWINAILMAPMLLLFGEVTPKTIAVSNPLRISAGLVAAPMAFWVKAINPLRWLIRGISDRVTTWIVGDEKAAENILQLDEFRSLIEAAEESQLTATERALIYNLLEAGDTEIVEIMIARPQTVFLNAALSVPELVDAFKKHRHSRVPVYRSHRDNVIGFLHAEHILRLYLQETDFTTVTLEELLHPPVMIPLTKKVDELFDYFQSHNARAAIVLNEFGGVEGFVSMTDVLSYIFGQLSEDVHGLELYHEQDEDAYEIPGTMKLTDFNNLTNFGIWDPRMTTIGGVVFRLLDRLPQVGDKVTYEDIVMTVLEMDEHRIAKIRVDRGAEVESSEEDEEELYPETATGPDSEPDSEPASDKGEYEAVETPIRRSEKTPEASRGER